MKYEYYADYQKRHKVPIGDAETHHKVCVPVSISVAFGKPYEKILDTLNKNNKNHRGKVVDIQKHGTYMISDEFMRKHKWQPNYFAKLPQKEDGCRYYSKGFERASIFFEDKHYIGFKRLFKEFPHLKKGKYILMMRRHWCAMVDGVLIDSFDSSNKRVYGFWEKPQ